MIEAFATTAALAEAATHEVERRLAHGVAHRGRASLVATGGRSPGPVYDRLKDAPIDWPRVVVTLSDDRFVPPDSADSNARLVRERLLSGAAGRAAFVPLTRGETPQAAAAAAEPALRALAPFDLVMLGMGEDGHVASLIPGSPFLPDGLDPAAPTYLIGTAEAVGQPALPRITLTLRALLEAHAILLLIAGDAKREVVAQALAGADLPVRAVLAQDRVPVRVLWSPRHEG